MDALLSLMGRNGFLPHGYCFSWTPSLLWTMVGADAMIAAAYFSIPVAILSYVRQRPLHGMRWLPWLFSGFIFACGLTHLMSIWTIWRPDYGLQALVKVGTAGISMATALALWPLMPRALKIPSVQQLRNVIDKLEAEVGRRRAAEDQLAATQQSLAVTLASLDAGFITTDQNGLVTDMNALAETVTGWPLHSAVGNDIWQVMDLWQLCAHDGRAPTVTSMNLLGSVLEDQRALDAVQRVVCLSRNGTHTALEVRAALTRASDGQVAGLAVVFRDMARLDTAEADSKRLAAIVESSNDAIISKTLDGQITSWNGAAQTIFGYTAEEAIGQPMHILIPPHLRDEEMRILSELAQGRFVPAFDTVRLRREGGPIDVSITISPIKDAQGRVIGASKIARDVSQQRHAERALRESEERLRFTLEAARIGDWDINLDTGSIQHSARYDQCFGYVQEQADWSVDRFLQHVHPEDREEVQSSLQSAMAEQRDWREECRVVWPDESIHWISMHGSVQRKADKATHMLGIVSDITGQRDAEDARLNAERLEAENRKIQEASQLKSLFLANMSHELRTPLNAVIGFADLLHGGLIKPESPEHHEFLGHIGTSGRHLLQLINDILDLAKVESGKFEFWPEPVDLKLMLKEVQDILHTAVSRKGLHISADVAADLTDLNLDPARLKQVLYNYLSNAIKFTPAGGEVTVRALAQGPKHFRIEVEDTGIGIAAADLPRLFTEFQQLDGGYDRQHQGTGLGLALTRRLVQAQCGEVGVRSTVGVGSVFYVVLNRTHGLDMGRAEAAARGVPDAEPDRVLVVEDDLRDQALLVEALTHAGFRVDAADNGRHAVRLARDTAYAALTLDLSLPDQRGLDVLGDIRSRGASHASPVVGVTMPADLSTRAAFAIANVLCKPIRSDELLAAMGRIRLPAAQRATVIVIDDEQASLDLMRATLQSIGVEAVCFQDGRDALQDMDRLRPDAIVLDLMMPGFDGFQVLDALQRLPTVRDVPVFIWTSLLLTDQEYATLARSARAIVMKGGGSLKALLDDLRSWRRPEVAEPGAKR